MVEVRAAIEADAPHILRLIPALGEYEQLARLAR